MDLGKLEKLAQHRVCPDCGAEFYTRQDKEKKELTALQQFCDHLQVHQPTAAQWAEAYNRLPRKSPQ